MKMQEIRELSVQERQEKLDDLQEEYFNLKFQLATGKIENPGRLKHMRRDIARIQTLRAQDAEKVASEKSESEPPKEEPKKDS